MKYITLSMTEIRKKKKLEEVLDLIQADPTLVCTVTRYRKDIFVIIHPDYYASLTETLALYERLKNES